jgi:hypothetical protein
LWRQARISILSSIVIFLLPLVLFILPSLPRQRDKQIMKELSRLSLLRLLCHLTKID